MVNMFMLDKANSNKDTFSICLLVFRLSEKGDFSLDIIRWQHKSICGKHTYNTRETPMLPLSKTIF